MRRVGGLLLVLVCASWAEDLEERVRALEEENTQLRERVDRLEEADAGAAGAVDDYLEEGLGLNLVVRRGEVQGIFQFFGDVGVGYDNPEIAGRSNAFFFNGSVDFFFTARVGDHFHVLSETVFLTSLNEPKDSSNFDQERLWGAWSFSDAIQVKLGLEHGPISRWNNLFHHGRWLETSVGRPLLARFEGGGGILPMHNAGVEISGSVLTGLGRLSYVVFVSNGRGRVPTDTHEFSDRNDDKAVELGLGLRPKAFQNLYVAVIFRTDKMPPNPTDPARLDSIREQIVSLQVDYRGESIEVLFEFAYLTNDDRQSSTSFDHYSSYLQVAYRVNDHWTPYARLDFREMDLGDPYFAPLGRDLDVWEALFGIRHDFVGNASIKLEVGFGEAEERDGGGTVVTRGYVRIGLQLAWVF